MTWTDSARAKAKAKIKSPIERFWDKVSPEPNTGCWMWTGALYKEGYASIGITIDGRHHSVRAHRWFYMLHNGILLDKETNLDHKCRNRWCVRPDHLEPVTQRENILRGIGFTAVNSRKTHCYHGHLYDDNNTHISPKTGWRICLTCRRIRSSKNYYKYGKAKRQEKTRLKRIGEL